MAKIVARGILAVSRHLCAITPALIAESAMPARLAAGCFCRVGLTSPGDKCGKIKT
jgi:hypothetical protein